MSSKPLASGCLDENLNQHYPWGFVSRSGDHF
jgi:hypothetical protein